ncbi:glycosyltransferase family 2 protein [Xenorhabdus sp. KJ12.1]|uniref:glycosyltransferase family 2 protein n=1 Tax=Xenorhabdus sp. KJ12.1 TaxID=1851571 RepID=UPI000C04703C|nr:glycosyltransferase family 2 protein [Xenorhabdus sp. KJ12.1]PHM66411.1 GDP-mannose pyrophosphorylase [Xenorhabdus sp. KJ12.1]
MLNIVIPMAGRGSRFSKAGYVDPKPFIPLGSKRMIEVVVHNLKPKCRHRFIFICQQKHLEKYNYENELQKIAPGCEVIGINRFTEGAACTVMLSDYLINNDEPLMIANSDQWIDIDIDDYLSYMQSENLDGLIMTMKSNDPKWSFVKTDSRGYVSEVVEKKLISDEATVGIYNYRRGSDFCVHARTMIERDERSNGEFYVAPVHTYMYKENGSRIGIYNIGEEANGMYGLGTPSDLNLFLSLELSNRALDF